MPAGTLTVNGQEISLQSSRSDAGFVATGAPVPECWHFLEGTSAGVRRRRFPATERSGSRRPRQSIWVLADKPGENTATLPNCLPSPERISLDSVCVLSPTPLASVSEETRKTATVEKIDGVFLDTLEPAAKNQGWGTLQKNRSVWEKEMTIGGKRFRRGLGTHSNSEIVYNLDGTYRRFQAGPVPTWPPTAHSVSP